MMLLIRKNKVMIDLKAARIHLPGRTTKNGKPRYLPIHGDWAPSSIWHCHHAKAHARF
jgi:hypothetical protein